MIANRHPIVKRIAQHCLVALLVMTTGCASIMKFETYSKPVDSRMDRIYCATRGDLYLLFMYWAPSSGGNGQWGISPEGCWFLTPITLVDLPLAMALDTVLLPVDIFLCLKESADSKAGERRDREAIAFWREAIETGNLPRSDASLYFTDQAQFYIKKELQDGGRTIGADILAALVSLSTSNHVETMLADLSRYPHLPQAECRRLYQWQESRPLKYGDIPSVWHALATNPATPLDIVETLARNGDPVSRTKAMQSGRLSPSTTRELLLEWAELAPGAVPGWAMLYSSMGEFILRKCAASHPATPPGTLSQLATNMAWKIREAVASNPSTPADTLELLSRSGLDGVKHAVAGNPATPPAALIALSRDQSNGVRLSVAANSNTPAEALVRLSSDSDFYVRRRVAANGNTPTSVLEMLKMDGDRAVRTETQRSLLSRE
jgi:uncharacterized protein YceK